MQLSWLPLLFVGMSDVADVCGCAERVVPNGSQAMTCRRSVHRRSCTGDHMPDDCGRFIGTVVTSTRSANTKIHQGSVKRTGLRDTSRENSGSRAPGAVRSAGAVARHVERGRRAAGVGLCPGRVRQDRVAGPLGSRRHAGDPGGLGRSGRWGRRADLAAAHCKSAPSAVIIHSDSPLADSTHTS